MDISIRNIGNKYAEITLRTGDTTIDSGLLSEDELVEYADTFLNAFDGCLDELSEHNRRTMLDSWVFKRLVRDEMEYISQEMEE